MFNFPCTVDDEIMRPDSLYQALNYPYLLEENQQRIWS